MSWWFFLEVWETASLLKYPRLTNGIIETFMFHSFFNSLARSRYLSLFSILSILLCSPLRQHSSQFCKFSLFWQIILRSGRLVEIRRSVSTSKPQRSLCVSFSRIKSGLCIYHFFVWSNFNFLLNSQLITLPTQSSLVLYSFCANWLYSLIMWLMVSFLSPHSLHLLFCCRLSILALICLVFMALFCAAIRRDSERVASSFKFL